MITSMQNDERENELRKKPMRRLNDFHTLPSVLQAHAATVTLAMSPSLYALYIASPTRSYITCSKRN